MNQGLFPTAGVQPVKPSRYKPVWTDRFFNGLVTNRSPLRSPLSAVYSDGYNMGRADTLLTGVNTEISPRLTVVRRPGNPAYSAATFPTAPNTFYSYKLANGVIDVMVDAADGVYQVTPASKTLIYTKPAGSAQSNFCGVGNLLYWGDGTTAQAWDPITNNVHQLGITASTDSPAVTQYLAIGSATNVIGPNFTAGGYVSTTSLVANNFTQSVEVLAKTAGAAADQPLISFESSQTGTSTTVYQALYLNAAGNLIFSFFDGTTQRFTGGLGTFNDNQWHQIGYSVQYVPDITNAISYTANGPTKQLSAGSQNLNLDSSVITNFSYTTSPAFSSAASPHKLIVTLWVDGQQLFTSPFDFAMGAGNGYWRIGNTSLNPTVPFQGLIAEVSTRHDVLTGVNPRFQALMTTGDPAYTNPGILAYENAISISTYALDYWWKLTEAAGTVAVESVAGVNTGTYRPTVTLHQSAPVRYVAYAASTAFTFGQVIIDTNGNLQRVLVAGTSGASAPAWATSSAAPTTDGTVIWGFTGAGSIKAVIGRKYCYSFVNKYGHFSTATGVNQPGLVGIGNRGAVDVSGAGSSDPQVAYIAIFATVDGGTTPFMVDMIPNNLSTARWHFFDTTPDVNLNILMAAPQAHSNDPAPQGATCLVYHMGRMWCAVGNLLYASGGPDTLVGNGNEAWPPANSWTYPSQIVKLVPHNTGLLILMRSGFFMHTGGPAITQFYPQPLFAQLGISNWNAVDASNNEITVFTSGRQLLTVDLLNNNLTDIGFPIQDQLQNLDPTQVYVARHHGGLDDAVFIADGATGWYKCIPRQPPDYSITGPVWSPKAEVLA